MKSNGILRNIKRAGRSVLNALDVFAEKFPFYVIAALAIVVVIATVSAAVSCLLTLRQ